MRGQISCRRWYNRRALGVWLTVAVLFGCARVPISPPGPVAVDGAEVGIASWYGREFHGRKTSSGEIYDMHDLTAAHRDLPLGTWILVTNLDNGRSVEVRVNDRGPFVANRVVDLSYGAGRLLGMIQPGLVPVRISVTRPAAADAGARPSSSARFTVQVGSFMSRENARRIERSLAETFSGGEIVQRAVGADMYYRVWVGDFVTRAEADATAVRLAQQGHSVLVLERH